MIKINISDEVKEFAKDGFAFASGAIGGAWVINKVIDAIDFTIDLATDFIMEQVNSAKSTKKRKSK